MLTPIKEGPRLPVLSGADHLKALESVASGVAKESFAYLEKEHAWALRMLGTALAGLYEVSSCNRHCFGTSHVLEALAGRIYNLGCSSYALALAGFYDESLNLIRSIGEAANVISMSVHDKKALREWLGSNKKMRLRKFSPAKVREILEKAGGIAIADKDWYSEFCEQYTHVGPWTRPNQHAQVGGFVGGRFSADGLAKALQELVDCVGSAALITVKYHQLEDYFNAMTELLDAHRRTEPM